MVESESPQSRLHYYGDDVLREICRTVEPDEPGLKDLIASMRGVMRRYDGVGLAAPQVGVPLRLFLAWPPDRRRERPLVFINPVLTEISAAEVPFEEGCLSFPDIYRMIVRPSAVTVHYQDLSWETRTLRADGLLARIIQHEIDHLDGVLLVDHLCWWERAGVVLRMSWRRLFSGRKG